jgi:hypothetical protein
LLRLQQANTIVSFTAPRTACNNEKLQFTYTATGDNLGYVWRSSGTGIFTDGQGNVLANPTQTTVFYQSLLMASELLKKGEQIIAVKDKVRQMCEAKPNVKLEYIEWVDTKNLKPVQNVLDGSVLLIAGYVGEVRLIDNLLLE